MAKARMSWPGRLASNFFQRQAASTSMPHAAGGGLALPRNKPGLGAIGASIAELPLPAQLVIPLLNYAKHCVEPHVAVNASVSVGSYLADGVIATANGIVSAIEQRPVIHPSYREALSVVIDVDQGLDQSTLALGPRDYLDVERLERACVAGLGGAGFGTADKILAATQKSSGIDTLLVNAVECEPLISCDEALIRSDAEAVVDAIQSMISLCKSRRCIVAIEQDKTEALAVLRQAITQAQRSNGTDTSIELVELPAIYPSGAERILIQRLTGQPTEPGTHASDLGVLCLNVATIVAARRAQQGHPLVSRIITVGGSRAMQAVNVRVRIGTPVLHVLQHTGNFPQVDELRIRAGGPLSGFDLADHEVPVTATTNCIGIEGPPDDTPAIACIRCAKCSDVCPVNLVPQQLHWYAASDDLDSATRFGLNNCIECGCCDVVCPSSIELTSTFRYARSASREQAYQNLQAELARERYEKRAKRLAEREQEAKQLREQKKAQLGSADDSIAAALARARARRKKP